MRKPVLVSVALATLVTPTAVQASWLSKITGVHVNLNGGPVVSVSQPDITAIPDMLRNLPKDASQFILSPQGTVLAAAIRHARGQVRPNAQPMPPAVKQALGPYFPSVILDKTRWAMRNDGRFALDQPVLGMFHQSALTLDDTIVFNSDIDPTSMDYGTLELWAHELTHVLQYQNMGVESFAFVYSYDFWEVEQQARDNASKIKTQLAQGTPYTGQYYRVASTIGSNQVPAEQLQRGATAIIPAQECVTWQTNQPGAVLKNVCNVPIYVTGWTQINPWNGVPYHSQCVTTCGLMPGAVNQFWSTNPGLWTDISFRYAM